MVKTKDIITEKNVVQTYQEGKYICFKLKNGITIKLDPNEAIEKREETKNVGHN